MSVSNSKANTPGPADPKIRHTPTDGLSAMRKFETSDQRLGIVFASLALRASDWGWRRIYDRWRRGEPVSRFHRKQLAVSAYYRARERDEGYDHLTIARIRPLPARSL